MVWIRRRARRTGWRNVSDELINGWGGMLFVARADVEASGAFPTTMMGDPA